MKPEVKMFAYSIIGTAVLLTVFFASQMLMIKKEVPAMGAVAYYRSTMNPAEVSPVPAKDSMGMEMEPVSGNKKASSNAIIIAPQMQQNMGVRCAEIKEAPLKKCIRTVGTIAYDESTLFDITTKFRGWITTLYVNTTGQNVAHGAPLFTIYSPELYSAQKEYLAALPLDALKKSALCKLRYFDVAEGEIAVIEKTGPKKALLMRAPHGGIVVEKNVVQGQMVEAGQSLYRMADLSTVWLQAEIYEQDLPFISLGQEAQVMLPSFPQQKYTGKISFIYPSVHEKTRTVTARIELPNPGLQFKPGMYATLEIAAILSENTLLVPASAVLRSGEKNRVFIALANGQFEPRTITLGPLGSDDMYQVLSGLDVHDNVVVSGQFMLDSESQLQEAIQKMLQPTKEPGV